jgi:hypothetical protein
MSINRKNLISIFLVFAFLTSPGNMRAKNIRGAEIEIQKTNGSIISGELIAVKKDSLLLVDSETSFDVSVNINQIQVIQVLRKSQSKLGALSGLLVGGAIGAATFGRSGSGNNDDCDCPNANSSSQRNIVGGVLTAGLGAVVGAIIGTAVGQDKIIVLEGLSPEQKELALEKLRKKARIPEYE